MHGFKKTGRKICINDYFLKDVVLKLKAVIVTEMIAALIVNNFINISLNPNLKIFAK